MRRAALASLAVLAMAGCRDETVAGYGALDTEWHLAEIDGAPYPAVATLRFGAEGEITGQAPCNRYFGRQTAPYPWFALENVGATRRACPELDQETLYLSALTEMTLSEVAGSTLILSNEAGRELVFRATQ